jgi:hypothetical protein
MLANMREGEDKDLLLKFVKLNSQKSTNRQLFSTNIMK